MVEDRLPLQCAIEYQDQKQKDPSQLSFYFIYKFLITLGT